MCTSPSFVWVKRGAEWVQTPAPCDRCWSCRENYINDWVGRCLCEASVSEVSVTLSLTYADPIDKNDVSHRVVNPHHFQLFIKRLRKVGHKIRYLAAGEYGELRARAHFHCILFFKKFRHRDTPPPVLHDRAAFRADPKIAHPLSRQIPQEAMVHIAEWPHGHIKVDWSASERSIRYCVEYLYEDGKKVGWSSQSKKPPLGFEWFAQKAALNVQYDVFPSTFEYLPPGGKPGKKYLMSGATRREYLNLITTNADDRPRMSKWVKATFDKIERRAFIEAADAAEFDDEAFQSRQKTVGQVLWEQIEDDRRCELAAERIRRQNARIWGFSNVEEFEAFSAAGGIQAHPEYFGRGSFDVQGEQRAKHPAKATCNCDACEAVRARIAANEKQRRAPSYFDRQGKPQWGEPDAEYLEGAFRRPPAPSDGA